MSNFLNLIFRFSLIFACLAIASNLFASKESMDIPALASRARQANVMMQALQELEQIATDRGTAAEKATKYCNFFEPRMRDTVKNFSSLMEVYTVKQVQREQVIWEAYSYQKLVFSFLSKIAALETSEDTFWNEDTLQQILGQIDQFIVPELQELNSWVYGRFCVYKARVYSELYKIAPEMLDSNFTIVRLVNTWIESDLDINNRDKDFIARIRAIDPGYEDCFTENYIYAYSCLVLAGSDLKRQYCNAEILLNPIENGAERRLVLDLLCSCNKSFVRILQISSKKLTGPLTRLYKTLRQHNTTYNVAPDAVDAYTIHDFVKNDHFLLIDALLREDIYSPNLQQAQDAFAEINRLIELAGYPQETIAEFEDEDCIQDLTHSVEWFRALAYSHKILQKFMQIRLLKDATDDLKMAMLAPVDFFLTAAARQAMLSWQRYDTVADWRSPAEFCQLKREAEGFYYEAIDSLKQTNKVTKMLQKLPVALHELYLQGRLEELLGDSSTMLEFHDRYAYYKANKEGADEEKRRAENAAFIRANSARREQRKASKNAVKTPSRERVRRVATTTTTEYYGEYANKSSGRVLDPEVKTKPKTKGVAGPTMVKNEEQLPLARLSIQDMLHNVLATLDHKTADIFCYVFGTYLPKEQRTLNQYSFEELGPIFNRFSIAVSKNGKGSHRKLIGPEGYGSLPIPKSVWGERGGAMQDYWRKELRDLLVNILSGNYDSIIGAGDLPGSN